MNDILHTLFFLSLFFDFNTKCPPLRVCFLKWNNLEKTLQTGKNWARTFSDEVRRIFDLHLIDSKPSFLSSRYMTSFSIEYTTTESQ